MYDGKQIVLKSTIRIISNFLFRRMVIVWQVKRKVVVEHPVLPLFQHAHATVVQISQLPPPYPVEVVEHV